MARMIDSIEVLQFIHKTLNLKGKTSDYCIHYEIGRKKVNGETVKNNRVVVTRAKSKDVVYTTPYHNFGTRHFMLSYTELMELTKLILENA